MKTSLFRWLHLCASTSIAFCCFVIFSHEAHATSYSWDGGGDGTSWTDANNWNLNSGYPDDNTDTATINAGSASITMSAATTIGELTLGSSYSGTLYVNAQLTVDDAGGQTGNVTVNGGTISHADDNDATTQDYTVNIVADGNMAIASGKSISVTGRGYQGGQTDGQDGQGPGAGTGAGSTAIAGGGAGHGGAGGKGASGAAAGGITYGLAGSPTTHGSGGGAGDESPGGNAEGGDGGGTIQLRVGGTLTISGSIIANGSAGTTYSSHKGGGGGAGGSINIQARTIAGNGTISANGGAGGNGSSSLAVHSGGGGGGGRIALVYETDSYSGTPTVSGGSSPSHAGSTGTLEEVQTDASSTPSVTTLRPTDNDTAASTNDHLTVTFDEPVNVATGNITIKKSSDDSTVETIDVTSTQVTGGGTDTITINPTADLSASTSYYVLIDATAFDHVFGNSFAGISDATTWNFTTGTARQHANYVWDGGGNGSSWDDEDNWNLDSGYPNDNTDTVTIGSSNDTITLSGATTIGALTVESAFRGTLSLNKPLTIDDASGKSGDVVIEAGTITHADDDDGSAQDYAVNIVADGDLAVGSGVTINVNQKGYQGGQSDGLSGQGPGGGAGAGTASTAAGGAGHGGAGGDGASGAVAGGAAYDSAANPTDHGSGGGAADQSPGGNADGGDGGGTVILSAGGTLTMSGSITANAGPGLPNTSHKGGGGGAGGTVNLRARIITGSGTITANGGAGGNGFSSAAVHSGGGGAGGRIAFTYHTKTLGGTPRANGGSSVSEAGASGTITNTSDTTAPSVSTLSPADGSTTATIDSNLVITFDETVTARTGAITIKKSSDDSTVETIPVNSAQVTVSGAIVTVDPSSDLDESTGYYIQIASGSFGDSVSNTYAGIADTTTWNFTTADFSAPTVSSLSPADNAQGVSTGSNLVMTFSENISLSGTGYLTLHTASGDSIVERISTATGAVSASGTVITINPSSLLSYTTRYYVRVDAHSFYDASGNVFAGIADATTWNFTTATGGTVTAPSADHSVLLAGSGATDVTVTPLTGSQSIIVRHEGEPVAAFTLDFSRSNRDLSDLTFLRDDANYRSLAHGIAAHTGASLSYTLYVKKSASHNRIRVCAGKSTAGCTSSDSWSFIANDDGDIVETNGGYDASDVTVSVVSDDWIVAGVTGTAAQGEASPAEETPAASSSGGGDGGGSGGRRGVTGNDQIREALETRDFPGQEINEPLPDRESSIVSRNFMNRVCTRVHRRFAGVIKMLERINVRLWRRWAFVCE